MKHECFPSLSQIGYRGTEGDRGGGDEDSLSKDGQSCSQEFRDLELTFSINLFFHSTITLPIYGWSEISLPRLWAALEQSFVTGFLP